MVNKISIATQTEMDFSNFHMLDDLTEAGQLPTYTSNLQNKQKPRSDVDNRAKGVNKNVESSNTIRDTRCVSETRVYGCYDNFNNPQPGCSGYKRTVEPERNANVFSGKQRNSDGYSDPFTDHASNPYYRGSSTMNPHHSRITFEDPYSRLQDSRRSREDDFDTFSLFPTLTYDDENDNPFNSQPYSQSSRHFDRG